MYEFKITDNATEDSKSIRFEVFCDEQGVIKSHEIDDFDTNSEAKHIVLYHNGKPIATSRFYRESGDTWHAGRIAVIKKYRGTGCGRLVLEKAEECMRDLGARESFISAQIQAQGFYEALGYKAYGDEYLEEDIPHIAMKKVL
nr:GNAT family N-acetyltransferase [Eubacteriales bacterium]